MLTRHASQLKCLLLAYEDSQQLQPRKQASIQVHSLPHVYPDYRYAAANQLGRKSNWSIRHPRTTSRVESAQ